MLPLVLLLVFLTGLGEGREAPPYCYADDGCATASFCQCVWFFQYCSIEPVQEGSCQFTTPGVVLIVFFGLVALVILILLIGALACCGHCLKGCCKRKKDHQGPVNIHCYPPVPSHIPYEQL